MKRAVLAAVALVVAFSAGFLAEKMVTSHTVTSHEAIIVARATAHPHDRWSHDADLRRAARAILTPALFVTVFSSDFNGTPLAGQAVSLDAVFAGNVLARISGDLYFMGLIFSTTSPLGPGFPRGGDDALEFGLPVEPAMSLGRSMSGRDGSVSACPYPPCRGTTFAAVTSIFPCRPVQAVQSPTPRCASP